MNLHFRTSKGQKQSYYWPLFTLVVPATADGHTKVSKKFLTWYRFLLSWQRYRKTFTTNLFLNSIST